MSPHHSFTSLSFPDNVSAALCAISAYVHPISILSFILYTVSLYNNLFQEWSESSLIKWTSFYFSLFYSNQQFSSVENFQTLFSLVLFVIINTCTGAASVLHSYKKETLRPKNSYFQHSYCVHLKRLFQHFYCDDSEWR